MPTLYKPLKVPLSKTLKSFGLLYRTKSQISPDENSQGIVDAFSSFLSSVYLQSGSSAVDEYRYILNETILINFIREDEIIDDSKKLENKLPSGG